MKRLSVIIPGYNTPDALWERCVRSVLAACGPDDEIICVDDGSACRPRVKVCSLVVDDSCRAEGFGFSHRCRYWGEGEEGVGGRCRRTKDVPNSTVHLPIEPTPATIPPLLCDRRAMAEKKVAEWLAGVDAATFEAALRKLVEEKTSAGEYLFERQNDLGKALAAAKSFFAGYSRRIVELSDGRCVYFAPDPRSRSRNGDNALCWAEYAFHAVSSGGDKIPGKTYNLRKYNEYKVINTDLIESTLKSERCVPVLRAKPFQDAIKFFGAAHLGGLFDVVVRLDEYGNVKASMTEVTFEASTKRGQKKLPQLVSLTEAIRTVVSHQTATGTNPPDTDNIANLSSPHKGGGNSTLGGEEVKVEGGQRNDSTLGLGLQTSTNTNNSTLTTNIEPKTIHCSPSTFTSSPQIHWLCLEKNVGQAVARNKALEVAQGRYVAFVDSDDAVEPEVYARSIAKLEESGADVCLFGVTCLWPAERLMKRDVPAACEACVPSGELVEKWFKGCVLNYIANKVVRKSFLDERQLRIDPDGMPCEDVMLFLETLIAGAKWCAIDCAGYNYYRNADTSLAHYKACHHKGTMACAETWARFCAIRADGEKFCGYHAHITPGEMAASDWENIWRGESPYSLLGKYRWLKENAAAMGVGSVPVAFIKQLLKSFIRQHFYIAPIRRRHYKSLYRNIEEIGEGE